MGDDDSIRFNITLTRSSGHYKIIFESMFWHGENSDMIQLHNMYIGTLHDETVLYANGKSMSYDDLCTHKYLELDIICIDDNASNICLGTFAHY